MAIPLPITTKSETNLREHWATVAKRKKAQRTAVRLGMRQAARPDGFPRFPVLVTLIRRGPRELDDDNLAASFKAVRDEVAAQLGATDGPKDPRIRWAYAQEKGPKGISIRIDAIETEVAA